MDHRSQGSTIGPGKVRPLGPVTRVMPFHGIGQLPSHSLSLKILRPLCLAKTRTGSHQFTRPLGSPWHDTGNRFFWSWCTAWGLQTTSIRTMRKRNICWARMCMMQMAALFTVRERRSYHMGLLSGLVPCVQHPMLHPWLPVCPNHAPALVMALGWITFDDLTRMFWIRVWDITSLCSNQFSSLTPMCRSR